MFIQRCSQTSEQQSGRTKFYTVFSFSLLSSDLFTDSFYFIFIVPGFKEIGYISMVELLRDTINVCFVLFCFFSLQNRPASLQLLTHYNVSRLHSHSTNPSSPDSFSYSNCVSPIKSLYEICFSNLPQNSIPHMKIPSDINLQKFCHRKCTNITFMRGI